MNSQNQINVMIPPETIENITTQLTEIKTLLAPYLHALTVEERGWLFKMGDETIPTVLKTKSYIETNPEFVPPYMDKTEFIKNATLVDQLHPIINMTNQIAR